jgi:pyridoxal phosphate enzyme (YggS family)
MIEDRLKEFKHSLPEGVTLVAVSKTKPSAFILEAYEAGQRDFGENKVQEMAKKASILSKDIRWHLIGHLQTNKVKYIAPFVHLIHSVDSLKLLAEINKQANKNNRIIDCLLQFHVAQEETKFGLSMEEAEELLKSSEYANMKNIRLVGVMGMASFTEDKMQVRKEFRELYKIFDYLKHTYFNHLDFFKERSMGMSSDYKIAEEEGSTMIRIGSTIFGERNLHNN